MRRYTPIDCKSDLDWLATCLHDLPANDEGNRVDAIKQVRSTIEGVRDGCLEEFRPIVDAMLQREPSAAARIELRYVLQALGASPLIDANLLAQVNPGKLRSFLTDIASHGIYAAKRFTALGFPTDFVATITREHLDAFRCDGSDKPLIGVSTLDFLRELADRMGVDSATGYMGRGRQVEELRQRILAALRKASGKSKPT